MMKVKQLKKKVQSRIDKKVKENSKHFSSEPMKRQISALIEVIAPLLPSINEHSRKEKENE